MLILKPQSARLDAAVAPDLRQVLIGHVDEGQQTILLDLTDVTFMDSSALGALIATVKKMGLLGTIAIATARMPVTRLLSLTRMDRVFAVHPTVEDAVKHLNG